MKKTLSYHNDLEHIRFIHKLFTRRNHSATSSASHRVLEPGAACHHSPNEHKKAYQNVTSNGPQPLIELNFQRDPCFFMEDDFAIKNFFTGGKQGEMILVSFQFFICRRLDGRRTSRSYLPKKIVSTIERESQRRNQTSSLERRLMLLLFHPTSTALPPTRHPVLHEKGFSSSQNRNFIWFVVGARKILTYPNDIGQ